MFQSFDELTRRRARGGVDDKPRHTIQCRRVTSSNKGMRGTCAGGVTRSPHPRLVLASHIQESPACELFVYKLK